LPMMQRRRHKSMIKIDTKTWRFSSLWWIVHSTSMQIWDKNHLSVLLGWNLVEGYLDEIIV
jgi:hypothetical protein